MTRFFAVLLRVLLVAAFVPILLAGTVNPTFPLLLIFVVLSGAAWISLRLWASARAKPVGFLIAVAACAAVWSLAVVSFYPVTPEVLVPSAP